MARMKLISVKESEGLFSYNDRPINIVYEYDNFWLRKPVIKKDTIFVHDTQVEHQIAHISKNIGVWQPTNETHPLPWYVTLLQMLLILAGFFGALLFFFATEIGEIVLIFLVIMLVLFILLGKTGK